MKLKWNSNSTLKIIKSTQSKFNVKQSRSIRSTTRSVVENDPDKFIDRIKSQILEVNDNGLPYSTPEDWDFSFYYLGGGSSRRKSSSILNRMSWEYFLSKYQKIIDEEVRSRG